MKTFQAWLDLRDTCVPADAETLVELRAVHPLDEAVGPWCPDLGPSVLDARLPLTAVSSMGGTVLELLAGPTPGQERRRIC